MKALFAGYGSIARRHVSNLRRICKNRDERLVVDLLRHAPAPAPEGVRLSTCDADDLDSAYDAVFVTTPTSEHEATLKRLFDKSDSFFVEKPAFDKSCVDASSFRDGDKHFYVACPLRYSNVIRWVKANVDVAGVVGLRAISSSYLPEWRPGADYRDAYSAHADMGGGVHIDLIHEWDYIVHLLGFPHEVKSMIVRRSGLEIDSADTALYIADWGDKTAEVHLDYYGRAPMRKLELICAEETYSCDLIAGKVDLLVAGESVDMIEQRDEYQVRELEHFLAIAAGEELNDSSIEHAMRVMCLAEGGMG